MIRATMLGAAAAMAAAAPVHAQLSLRMGAVRARYADSPPVTALQVGPRVDLAEQAARFSLEANWARFDGGGWAAQASAEGVSSYVLGRAGMLGILVSLGGNALEGGTWSGQAQGGLVFGRGFGPVVASLGVTGGVIQGLQPSTFAGKASSVVTLRATAGGHAGPVDVALRSQRAIIERTAYTDAELGLSRRLGVILLDAGAGLRKYDSLPAQATWRAQAIAQLIPQLGLEVAGGRSARSLDGFAEGHYLTAGLRLIAVRRPPPRPLVERLAPRQVRVRFALGGAREVAIAGDWNDWTPAPLTRDGDGRWSAVVGVGPGTHKFVLVVDGRQTVPRGVLKLPDGFGGEVGLLVVD